MSEIKKSAVSWLVVIVGTLVRKEGAIAAPKPPITRIGILADSIMMVVLLILLISGIVAFIWMIKDDENFRMWMNHGFFTYYNRAEKLHEQYVGLVQAQQEERDERRK